MKKLVLLFIAILIIISCGKKDNIVDPGPGSYNVNGWMLISLPGVKDNTTGYQFYKLYAVNLTTGEKKFLFDSALSSSNIIKDKIVFLKAMKYQVSGNDFIVYNIYSANPTGDNIRLVSDEQISYNDAPYPNFVLSTNSDLAGILSEFYIKVINISNGTVKSVNIGNINLVPNFGFSNDGNKLFFSYLDNMKMALYVYDLKTDNSFSVSSDGWGGIWSKDDKYFYFTESANNINKLNKYNIATRKVESSFNINKLTFSAISNNSQNFIYSEDIQVSSKLNITSVWVSKSDGTNLRKITPNDELCYVVNSYIPYYDKNEIIAIRYKSDDSTKLSLLSINVNTGAIRTINDNLLK